MNSTSKNPPAAFQGSGAPARGQPLRFTPGLKALLLVALVVTACFAKSLYQLAVFAWNSDLYSYILLVPFVSGYLAITHRSQIDLPDKPRRVWALIPLLGGTLALVGCRVALSNGWAAAPDDYLCLMTLSFLLFLLGSAFVFLGTNFLRSLAFPIGFAFFAIPLPEVARHGIETFLQWGSADVAAMMLRITGMPVYQNGTAFQLPGKFLDVAPECSGIHSSFVLIMVSTVAGHLFLNSRWRRSLLLLAVIPLALLRNGFRIFTIAQLCVHIGPHMIDSPIHRRGGPIFFALSMIPFLLLLLYLRKGERQRSVSINHS